ncbi:hypothetical protein GTW51_18005 [Aurantimonas aggregata]|uniref:Uncharacterized protein n=1 Tax=Aurantimonas aggregata TaxID=2047720 RepID=A0A6L9ML71_9HYPH|nr:hypothetical protein [Aurantimonas aggregata]NDV88599.1 hypothetical protein [Aurantimonas aggregata]
MQSQTLKIDQALYGYVDGHRQLAASLNLSSSDAYDLAARSDLAPGARMSASSSYINGFTLKESGAFAYIKTWSAPEQSRPGCVWSHILLLPRAFLSTQIDLGVLQTLFSRPDPGISFDRYSEKINVRRLAKSPPADPALVAVITSSYYQNEEVICSKIPGEEFERSLLAVWSQQWPKLRSEFMFSTVFTSDNSKNKGLIIRVSTSKYQSSVVDREANYRLDWLPAAVSDAISPNITHLRRFLWRYGKDVSRPKKAFEQLIRTHLAIEGGERISLSADDIINRFPKPLDAATLKRDLLGAPAGAPPLVSRLDGKGFVELATHAQALSTGLVKPDEVGNAIAAFDQLDIKRAALALHSVRDTFEFDRNFIRELLVQNVEPATLDDASIPIDFVLDALRNRPELIGKLDLDRLEESDVIGLLEIADDPEATRRLLRKLMSLPRTGTAKDAVAKFSGDAFVEAVRLCVSDELGADWRDTFSSHSREVMTRALPELSGKLEIFHALSLIYFSMEINEAPKDVWEAANRSGADATTNQNIAVDAYLIAFALRYGLSESIDVIQDVLPRLRIVALRNSFTPHTRVFLERSLPHISNDWDINKRLLKILRRSRRKGLDVTRSLKRMDLSDSEIAYILEDDSQGDNSSIFRIFFPWS